MSESCYDNIFGSGYNQDQDSTTHTIHHGDSESNLIGFDMEMLWGKSVKSDNVGSDRNRFKLNFCSKYIKMEMSIFINC